MIHNNTLPLLRLNKMISVLNIEQLQNPRGLFRFVSCWTFTVYKWFCPWICLCTHIFKKYFLKQKWRVLFFLTCSTRYWTCFRFPSIHALCSDVSPFSFLLFHWSREIEQKGQMVRHWRCKTWDTKMRWLLVQVSADIWLTLPAFLRPDTIFS